MPSVDLIVDNLPVACSRACHSSEGSSNCTPYVINFLITELIMDERACRGRGQEATSSFYLRTRTRISFEDYLLRIQKLTDLEDEVFFLALIYFDRVLKDSELDMSKLSVHKLFLVALVVATKYISDEYLSIEKMAKIGGICCLDLQKMETEFLERLDYKLFVLETEYKKYVDNIFKLFCIPEEEDN